MATLKSVFNNLLIPNKKQEFNYNGYNFSSIYKQDSDKIKRIHIIQKETKIENFFTEISDEKQLEGILNYIINDIKKIAGTKFVTLINESNPNLELLKILFK